MKENETLSFYSIECEYNINSPLTIDILKDLISKKLGTDIITFTLSFNFTNDIEIWNEQSGEELSNLIKKYNEEVTDDDDIAFLKIEYEKVQGQFTIYSPRILLKELKRLSFEHFYNAFNERFGTHEKNSIHSKDEFSFRSTLFKTNNYSNFASMPLSRKEILENWSYFTNIQGIKSPRLLPTDFIDEGIFFKSEGLEEINKLFTKFTYMLSLIFLSDVVNINENDISLKINSYNRLSYKINYKNIKLNNFEQLLNIFKWVYTTESSFLADDKIVFAKDQLSRKLFFNNKENCLTIDESTLPSILSMHRIYLKENANQYIETTNTVAELISKIAIQQKEIQNSIVSAMKTSSSIFLSLFISLLVFNTLSSGKATVFNAQNFFLTILFAIISMIALYITRYQVNKDLMNVIEQFEETKKVYTSLFNIDDLNKLFDKKYTLNLKNNVENTKKFYSIIWIIEIILVVLVVTILTFTSWLKF